MELVVYALVLVAVLTLLAISHELGHFVAAKLARVQVESFEIGAGPAILRFFDREGTCYKLGVIPFGAFTTLVQGGRLNLPGDGTTTFEHAAPMRKLMVAVAGAASNFGVAFVILLGLQVGNFPQTEPIIEIADKDAPAYLAGLRSGDRIVAVDGIETVGWQGVGLRFVDRIGDSGPLEIGVVRDGRRSEHSIPISDWQSDGRWVNTFDYLGIRHASESRTFVPDATLAARLVGGVVEMYERTVDTVGAGLKVVYGSLSIFSFGGALQLTHLGEYGASLGLLDWVKLFALCSIAAGMVNLLPGPIVDGTVVGLAVAELVSGKRLGPEGVKIGRLIGAVVGLTPLFAAVVHEILRLVT